MIIKYWLDCQKNIEKNDFYVKLTA